MVDAVVSRGVMPDEPTAMFGVTVPDQKISLPGAPVTLPVEKCVMVEPAPVDAGKSMLATGDVDPALDAVQPPVVRAGATRA